MEISNLTQPILTADHGFVNTQTEIAPNATSSGQTSSLTSPVSDTFSITQSHISVARAVMAQQIDLALEIQSPTVYTPELITDRQQHVDSLVNKVLQKIHDEQLIDDAHEHKHETDDDHVDNIKNIQLNVEQGFQKSVSIMNQMGIMNDSVNQEIDHTQSQVNQAINNIALNASSATFNSASATQESSTSLQLTTQEGDVITINLSRSQSASSANLQNSSGSLIYTSSQSKSHLSIHIQGDLSEKESHSIKEVIQKVNNLAEKLFNGEMTDAMQQLSELDINTKQLSSLALSMSNNISYEAVSTYTQVSNMTGSSVALTDQPPLPAQPVSELALTPGSVNTTNSNLPTVNQTPPQADKPASMFAVDMAAQTTDIMQTANHSHNFENTAMEIHKLFDQLADLFSFENNHHKAKDFISDLFHDLVERLEDDD